MIGSYLKSDSKKKLKNWRDNLGNLNANWILYNTKETSFDCCNVSFHCCGSVFLSVFNSHTFEGTIVKTR